MNASQHASQELLKEAQRLEDCSQLDIVGDRQPKHPPPLDDSLVGRQIEIRWRYWRPAQEGERGNKKQVLVPCMPCIPFGLSRDPTSHASLCVQQFIWCEGTVVEVSDGTIRKSKRSKESLPAGAVRIRWPADKDFNEKETFQWSILNPEDWNRDVHLGWRWLALASC